MKVDVLVRYSVLVLMSLFMIFVAFKTWQVWSLVRSLPAADGASLHLVWHARFLDCLRLQIGLAGREIDEQALRDYFGVYTEAGDDMAALRREIAVDHEALQQLSAVSKPSLLISLTASGYARKDYWARIFSLGFVRFSPESEGGTPRLLGGRWLSASLPSPQGILQAGLLSRSETARNEVLLREWLPGLAGPVRDQLVMHRVNTLYRQQHQAPLFTGIELDVIDHEGEVEVNHPPMRRSGLSLARLMQQSSASFVWLDWKNPEPAGFASAVGRMHGLMRGKEYLIEIPLAYFRNGGNIPDGLPGKFSLYLPTKEIKKCRDGCAGLAREVNMLLERYPALDCSFDSDVFPWVMANIPCGRNHGIYSWYLEPLSSSAVWVRAKERHDAIREYAAAHGVQQVRFIVRLNSAFI